MEFVVTKALSKHEKIEHLGMVSFTSLPLWAQDAPQARIVVVIRNSSSDVQTLVRSLRKTREKPVIEWVFSGDIYLNYIAFFAWFLKSVVDADPIRSQVFMHNARVVCIQGESNRLSIETLYRHLAWYFIHKDSLYQYNQVRYDLCKKIASDLMSVSLPQGTLQ